MGFAGPDVLIGGPGADDLAGDGSFEVGDLDRFRAGRGADEIHASDGVGGLVDCGGGIDEAFVDPDDDVRSCETVNEVPAGEGYRRPVLASRLGTSRHRCPTGDDGGFRTSRLEGHRLHLARVIAARHNCSVRVIRRNGEWLGVTDDLKPRRINVSVVDGRVDRVYATY